jgi:hypothetical protein
MKNKLETKVIKCIGYCQKPTKHIYLGEFGVQWKPIHIYQCKICRNQYHALEKIEESIE